jgi:hypothetical protein|tara:strand:- start:32 stop:313 length:282 start_codon:yes stop_codon:yes gene_type:complete
MGKKSKTIELKARKEKISKEHLESLQSIVNSVNTLQFNVGKIEAQKHAALHDLAAAQDKIALMQQTLVKEYGTFDVNLLDGTINWPSENGDTK